MVDKSINETITIEYTWYYGILSVVFLNLQIYFDHCFKLYKQILVKYF